VVQIKEGIQRMTIQTKWYVTHNKAGKKEVLGKTEGIKTRPVMESNTEMELS
jgi:hypothetical protein